MAELGVVVKMGDLSDPFSLELELAHPPIAEKYQQIFVCATKVLEAAGQTNSQIAPLLVQLHDSIAAVPKDMTFKGSRLYE